METGGELSNTGRPYKHKMKSPEEQTTSSFLHSSKESNNSRRSHFGQKSKRFSSTKGEKSGAARNSSSFGYGAEKETSHDRRRIEKPLFNPSAKASTLSSKDTAQSRINSTESADGQLKDNRDPRLTPSSAQMPIPEHTYGTRFNVKMADFTELSRMASNRPDIKLVEKDTWSQNASSMRPWSPCLKGELPATDPRVAVTSENSFDISSGHQTVISWAVVASQLPKKASPKEMTIRDIEQGEIMAHQEEILMGKKKRRKKKKKPKDTLDNEDGKCSASQQPPKFEDVDEFPELNTTGFCEVTHSGYSPKLRNQKDISEDGPHLFAEKFKEKLSLKSQPAEINKKAQKSEKTSGKKSNAPVQLDIGNMLAVLEETHKSNKSKSDVKSVISVGGGLHFIPKQPHVQKKQPWQQEKIAHNPLDSTSPLVKKGKQREKPKAKKPTPLKKIILKEREERKQRRLLDEQGLSPVQVTDTVEEEQHTTNSADEEDGTVVQEGGETYLNDTNDNNVEPPIDEGLERQSPTITDFTLKPKIHSRKFRDYCSQMLSKEVDECVTTLLKELVRFQDRLHQKDPMKARMKRRIVMGLREVLKHLKLRKVKCVIISPNCERVQSKGGLDEALHTIINTCREQEVPFIFALSRKALGRCLNKVVPVSLVGIFNYDGAQDHYHKMIELSSEARKAYEVMVCSLEHAEHEDAEDWQAANVELKINRQSFTRESDPFPVLPEEPEYIKIWKTLLKDCNHEVLDFQSRLVDLGAVCHVEDDEPS
ncbi:selenocysteine insertion sequence-binding protein 2-like isoform X1 [Synchiropus splendidus]|uniref:selenocysteine insertion sequence-binding protein 2-like isoform X1 n=1 Tax=Synchiropus splendidus TaxID=270530 RepID=UPI00237EE07D|nr:selenocysteine insertion sequence-binding protein 2-like isoform X1 [Synchiropus splendidus]